MTLNIGLQMVIMMMAWDGRLAEMLLEQILIKTINHRQHRVGNNCQRPPLNLIIFLPSISTGETSHFP